MRMTWIDKYERVITTSFRHIGLLQATVHYWKCFFFLSVLCRNTREGKDLPAQTVREIWFKNEGIEKNAF